MKGHPGLSSALSAKPLHAGQNGSSTAFRISRPRQELDVFKSQCPNRMDYVRQCLGIAGQSGADASVEEPIEWDADE